MASPASERTAGGSENVVLVEEVDIEGESDLGIWNYEDSGSDEDDDDQITDETSCVESDGDDVFPFSDVDDSAYTTGDCHEWYEEEPVEDPLECDDRLIAVSKALKDVAPPGDFFVSGICTVFPPPGVVVNGMGDLPLPLTDKTAASLIQQCQLAPYGHGEQTIVDPEVRNTWELAPNQFSIENSDWQPFVDTLVDDCRVTLGIDSSVSVDAKLYKLLLYETGGKFDKHQDSEKEEESYTWDAGAEDPLIAKYAAFYGDCPHEITPVSKGYRLCLTYNLIAAKVDDPSEHVPKPHFTRTHPLYAALQVALCGFFSKDSDGDGHDRKRQRTDEGSGKQPMDFDITNPETHRSCKLVYMLKHKYTQAGLSFKYLKGKDSLAAAALAAFCEESHGAFQLFLCKVSYEYERRSGGVQQKLVLRSPWIADGDLPATSRAMFVADIEGDSVTADLANEVAPSGYFGKKMDYDTELEQLHTGNEGAKMEKWYKSAALVLVPVKERFRLQLSAEADTLFRSWLPLVDSNPFLAKASAAVFSEVSRDWSLETPEAIAVLDGVHRLGCATTLKNILLSCDVIHVQPKLREVAASFPKDVTISMLEDISLAWRAKHDNVENVNRMKLALSFVCDETDPTMVAAVLDALDPKVWSGPHPKIEQLELGCTSTPPQEYTELLHAALTVSLDQLKKLVAWDLEATLVLVVAPAIRLLVDKLGGAAPIELRPVIQEVHDALESEMSSIHQESYQTNRSSRFYGASSDISMEFDNAAFVPHVQDMLTSDPQWLEKLTVQYPVAGSSKVVVKKTYDSPLYGKAREELAAISKLLDQ